MACDFVKSVAVYYEILLILFHIFMKIAASLNSREMNNDGIIWI